VTCIDNYARKTERLRERGILIFEPALGAVVSAYDPASEREARHLLNDVEFAGETCAVPRGVDEVANITEWEVFRAPNIDLLKAEIARPSLLDQCDTDNAADVRAVGLITWVREIDHVE
jgi:UDPglucose 6-dehydrogenase